MKKLQLGSCFYYVSSNGREHPYYVITEPLGNPLRFVAVNITNYAVWKDQTVILDSGHAAVTKTSVVNYAEVIVLPVDKIEAEINDGEHRTMLHHEEPVCSAEFLKILQDGLLKSKATPLKFKEFCKRIF